MDISVDIWLRGEIHATTQALPPVGRDPGAWTDADVVGVLTGMLRAMDLAKSPDADPVRPIALRGFSWIVNPYETGGVVIAIEMALGAAVAGPFDITESELTRMIERVVEADRTSRSAAPGTSETIH